jgi:uncharacterized protein YejL (UPF0352 family)
MQKRKSPQKERVAKVIQEIESFLPYHYTQLVLREMEYEAENKEKLKRRIHNVRKANIIDDLILSILVKIANEQKAIAQKFSEQLQESINVELKTDFAPKAA